MSNQFDHEKLNQIQAACIEASKRSQAKMSLLTGVTVAGLEDIIKQGRHMLMMATAQTKAGDNYQQFLDDYYEEINGMDFWQITEYHHKLHVQDAYEVLETIFDETLIEQGYIVYLGKQLGMIPEAYESFGHFVRDFTKYIPHIYLYEYEFNAFLNGKSEVNNFPALVFYQSFYGVLQNMATIIVRNLYEAVEMNGKVYVKDLTVEQISTVSTSPLVYLGLIYNIDVMTGKKAFSAIDITQKPGVEGLVDAVVDLVVKFVTLHEYGHLFRAHLFSDRPMIDLEFDADYFAIGALSRFAVQKRVNAYAYNLAISIVFFCYHIREQIIGQASQSHPLAQDRFNHIVGMMQNNDLENSPQVFWEKISLLVSPTLLKNYHISL
jgi:hypothetical protein